MKFRTEVNIEPSPRKISHRDKVILLGSCFSDNIGEKMESFKFNVDFNPLGITYNPWSLCRQMSYYGIDGNSVAMDELWITGGVVSHFDFHGCNNSLDKDHYMLSIEQRLDHFCDSLLTADWLFLTLGTAWVYREKASGHIVNNCHKRPSSHFEKALLPLEDITRLLKDSIQRLILINSDIRIVLTISPVRHLKDGVIENNRSKSRLIESAHEVCASFEQVQYFHAYELLMDDLRDYRYYAEDLVHPADQGISYIWEHFCHHFFDKETVSLLTTIKKINDARKHRLLRPGSDAMKHFTKKSLLILHELRKRAPYLDLSEEYAYFNMLKSTIKEEDTSQ